MSALLSTTRRVLGGAAISAVLLGAGSGMAFAGDIDNSDAASPTFADQTNAAIAGNGAVGGNGGDSTGGSNDDDDDDDDGDVSTLAGDAAGGGGGTGGDGGSVGDNAPTQNYNNQQQLNAVDMTCNIEGDNNTCNQIFNAYFDANNNQQGADSSYGDSHRSTDGVIKPAGQDCPPGVAPASQDCPDVAPISDDCPDVAPLSPCDVAAENGEDCADTADTSDVADTDVAPATYDATTVAAEDYTPVGAADTGDGSFSPAAQSNDLGGELAAGGAISAAALLAAYGVSVARRRRSAHAAL